MSERLDLSRLEHIDEDKIWEQDPNDSYAWINPVSTKAVLAEALRAQASEDALKERVRVLEETSNAKEEALERIAELAHHASTGPAVEDTYWEIRREAYNAFAISGGKGEG